MNDIKACVQIPEDKRKSSVKKTLEKKNLKKTDEIQKINFQQNLQKRLSKILFIEQRWDKGWNCRWVDVIG